MRGLQRTTGALPRATPGLLRTCATRHSRTINTLQARQKTSGDQQRANAPATSATTPLDLSRNQGVYGANWSSHFTASSESHSLLQQADDPARALYTTQIYHGQARPPSRRGIHHHSAPAASSSQADGSSSSSSSSISRPAAGAGTGTGVSASAQKFGSAVKGNPTESEADVAADRAEDDPLPPELHHTIQLGAGGAAPRRTESEEDVVADRGAVGEDPLARVKKDQRR
ncbi:hypothetical protein MYCTH_2307924 [Thermothelomyces thermophilus ATCC 42464]|uniref:Uncharacterized protein n=1 Tax=Thermothelomyces thermophilus (strain ATCC 42464 / BCRC 31852 / DSM 1799) TaxID=573729 RepID=G2QIK9_THET4|nr:uncharacterized protein MYCTH_2307924 [Thermothelomyces thermophilus ATCC 42464]AEO59540.1 hypothetical protein MYCTH_2307924 [Thermothelomyces thermophilus ATCC 42464]